MDLPITLSVFFLFRSTFLVDLGNIVVNYAAFGFTAWFFNKKNLQIYLAQDACISVHIFVQKEMFQRYRLITVMNFSF